MAKKRTKPKSPFLGRWRIVSMSAWDQDFVNEEEEGYFEFRRGGGNGEFHFGYVHGHMDCRDATRGGGAGPRMDLGTATTRWTPPRAGAGPSWTASGSWA